MVFLRLFMGTLRAKCVLILLSQLLSSGTGAAGWLPHVVRQSPLASAEDIAAARSVLPGSLSRPLLGKLSATSLTATEKPVS